MLHALGRRMTTTIQLQFDVWGAARYVVTPEQAQYWLDHHNTQNRRVRPKHAQNLARQMGLGFWDPITHEGVAFDTNGVLLDGQHRLMAVALHGKPVELLIWTGIPPKARLVVGDAARRTAADSLKLSGYDIDRRIAGMLMMMMGGVSQVRRGERPSTRELEAFFLKYRDAIAFVTKNLPHTKNVPLHAGIMAAAARAYYHVNADLLEQFCESYMKSLPVGGRNCSAPLALRGYVAKNAGKLGSTKARHKLYRITENMIRKFVAGESVELVKGFSTELYPLPDKHLDRTPTGAVVMRRRPGEPDAHFRANTDAAIAVLTGEPRI